MRILIVSMTALIMCASFPPEARARRGAFAFHYSPSLSDEALAWYSRFDVLVTHDPLPPDQVKRLHAAGTRLVLYEWSVAFYDSRATDWQRSLLPFRDTLLNQKPLTGGVGSPLSAAWYFDPASAGHAADRAVDLSRRVKESGYDGVFFDTTTFDSVHQEAREEYARRHPDTPYDAAFSRFLIELRKQMPKGILFTNQGYRKAEYYLPYVDWDLTESLVTRPVDGRYELRSWNDPADPWNSIHFVMQTMIEPIAARYPNVRFGSLNYIDHVDPEMVRVVVATSQLFGGEGYVAAPAMKDEVERIYFRNPGKPMSRRIDRSDGKASWRFFQRGLVVVTAADEAITIDVGSRALRDYATRAPVCGGKVTIPASPGVPRAYFFDHIPDCSDRLRE